MVQISDCKYILNYDEIINLINQGYKPIGDLKETLSCGLLLKGYKKIETYIDTNRKIIDIYWNFRLLPYPHFI